MAKIDSLLSRASEVRDATLEKENTALRVGSLFVDLIQTITAVLPREILEASGISVAASASDVTISYKKILNDGSAGTGRITIPAVTETGAGVITPALLARIREGLTDISEAIRAAGNAQTSADTANNTAANNTALIKQLQGNLQIVDWILKSISAGTAAPDSVKAKMRRVNAWSSEEDEREIVLLPGATEEAAGAMTAQQVKDLKLAKGLMATKGHAYGLAPLDADKHVPDANIAPSFIDVLMFDGCLNGTFSVEPMSSGLAPGAEGTSVIYAMQRKRFVFGVRESGTIKPTYFNNFSQSERYGTKQLEGVAPEEGKIYIDRSTGRPYYWNGETLAQFTMPLLVNGDDFELSENYLELTEMARHCVFDDIWMAAVGSHGSLDYSHTENGEQKPYCLNEIWLTYEEAIAIIAEGYVSVGYAEMRFLRYAGRTVLPLKRSIRSATTRMFDGAANLETVFVDLMEVSTGTFSGCSSLREIFGSLQIFKDVPDAFKGCAALERIQGLRISCNVNFSDSPRLSLDTFSQIADKSAPASPATVTVHPDVYAKFTGDTTNPAAAALTADLLEQWQSVFARAAKQNISFATV